MKPDNSSYTVTSPDLHLTESGLNVLISSTNKTFLEAVKLLFEKYIMSSIVFNVQDKKTNSASLPWMWHVSRTCEFMIVDLDTCAWEDIMAALMKTRDESHQVIFFNSRNKKREAVRLINATSKYVIFNTIGQIDTFLDIETQTPGLN
jgi:choline kinase